MMACDRITILKLGTARNIGTAIEFTVEFECIFLTILIKR